MGGKLLETIIEMGIFKSVDSVSLKFAVPRVDDYLGLRERI